MSLWVDSHRPTTLSRLSLHATLTNKLRALAKSEELPHLLFYGPSGGGKKTRVMAMLREIFGAGVERVKVEHRSFKTSTNKVIEISTIGSNYHIECNPSDAGNNDRFVIQEVIKEIASHGAIQSSNNSKSFKVVVLTEADKLSRQVLYAFAFVIPYYLISIIRHRLVSDVQWKSNNFNYLYFINYMFHYVLGTLRSVD